MQDPLTREQVKIGDILAQLFASTQLPSHTNNVVIREKMRLMAKADDRLQVILGKQHLRTELTQQETNYLDFAHVRAALYLEVKNRMQALAELPKQQVIADSLVDNVLSSVKSGLDERVAKGQKTQIEADEEYRRIHEDMLIRHGQSVNKLMDDEDRLRRADERKVLDLALGKLSLKPIAKKDLNRAVSDTLEVFILLAKSNTRDQIDYATMLNVESHPLWQKFASLSSAVDASFEHSWHKIRNDHLHEEVVQSCGEARTFFLLRPFISVDRKKATGQKALDRLASNIELVEMEKHLQKYPQLVEQRALLQHMNPTEKIIWWVDFLQTNHLRVSKELKEVREMIDQVEKGRLAQAQANKQMLVINALRLFSMVGPQMAELAGDDLAEYVHSSVRGLEEHVDTMATQQIALAIHPLLAGYFDTYSHFPADRHEEISQKLASLIYETSKSYITDDNERLVEILHGSLSDTELWDAIGYTALPFLAHAYEQEDILVDVAESLASLTEWGQSPLDLGKLKAVGLAQHTLTNALLKLIFAIRDYDPNNIVFDIDVPKELHIYNDDDEGEVFPIAQELVEQMNEELVNPNYLPPVEFYHQTFDRYDRLWREIYGTESVVPEIHRTMDDNISSQLGYLISRFIDGDSIDAVYSLSGESATDWFSNAMISTPDFEEILDLIKAADADYAQKFAQESMLNYYHKYIDFITKQSAQTGFVDESQILAFALVRCNGNLSDASREVAILYKLLGRYDLNSGAYYGGIWHHDFFSSSAFEQNLAIWKLIKFESTATRVPIDVLEQLPVYMRQLSQYQSKSFGYKEIELADLLGIYHYFSSRAVATYSSVPTAMVGLMHSLNESPVDLRRGSQPGQQSGTKAGTLTMMAKDNIDYVNQVLVDIPITQERVVSPEISSNVFWIDSLSLSQATDLDLLFNAPIIINADTSFVLLKDDVDSLINVYVGSHEDIANLLKIEKYGLGKQNYLSDHEMSFAVRLRMLSLFSEHKLQIPLSLSQIDMYWREHLSDAENTELIRQVLTKLQESNAGQLSYQNIKFLLEKNIEVDGLSGMIEDILSAKPLVFSMDFYNFLLAAYQSGHVTSLDYPVVHSLVDQIIDEKYQDQRLNDYLIDLIIYSKANDTLGFLTANKVSITKLGDFGTWWWHFRSEEGDLAYKDTILNMVLREFVRSDNANLENSVFTALLYDLDLSYFTHLVDEGSLTARQVIVAINNIDKMPADRHLPNALALYEYIQHHPGLNISDSELSPLLTQSLINGDMPSAYFPRWLQSLPALKGGASRLYDERIGIAIKPYISTKENHVENRQVLTEYCIEHDVIIADWLTEINAGFSKDYLVKLIIADNISDGLKRVCFEQLLVDLKLTDLSKQSVAQLTSESFVDQLFSLHMVDLPSYFRLFGSLLGQNEREKAFAHIQSIGNSFRKFEIYQAMIDGGAISNLSEVSNLKNVLMDLDPDFIVADKPWAEGDESVRELIHEAVLNYLTFAEFIVVLENSHTVHNHGLDPVIFDKSNLGQMEGFNDQLFKQMLVVLQSEIGLISSNARSGRYDDNFWEFAIIMKNISFLHATYGEELSDLELRKELVLQLIRVAGPFYQIEMSAGNYGYAQEILTESLSLVDQDLFTSSDKKMVSELFPRFAEQFFNAD